MKKTGRRNPANCGGSADCGSLVNDGGRVNPGSPANCSKLVNDGDRVGRGSLVKRFAGPAFCLAGLLTLLLLFPASPMQAQSRTAPATGKNKKDPAYYLIAHRGGVVDSTNAENSLPALDAAIKRGYDMVEMDMRLTKDSVLIIHHDRNFKRYYGVDSNVSALPFSRVRLLKSDKGYGVVSLEEEFIRCRQGHMQVMLDTKFDNYDTVVYARITALLKKYGLQEQALMIGSDSSTEYFTGKVRLSCTRRQLEENSHRADYKAAHYFLFGGVKEIGEADVEWAARQGIMVVGAVNIFSYRQQPDYLQQGLRDIETLRSRGVRRFQIDSNFDGVFFK